MMPLPLDLDIFSPLVSRKPWPNTVWVTGSPAAISIAGQMTQWKRVMSLPTKWYCIGQRWSNSPARSPSSP